MSINYHPDLCPDAPRLDRGICLDQADPAVKSRNVGTIVLLIMAIIFLFPACIFASEVTLSLEKAPINTNDLESIKRGAKFFASTCMACHTLIYLRYNKLAHESGITYEKMPVNVQQWPLGVKPPDLSLEANYRGVDWIYTYLHSFYQDTSRPTGFNNLLLPNSAMTWVLAPIQGKVIKLAEYKSNRILAHHPTWYELLVLQQQGTLTPMQYDALIADVVNFLHYAANPYQSSQRKMGVWVVGGLIILFVLTFFLKQEYWKDVKNKKNK